MTGGKLGDVNSFPIPAQNLPGPNIFSITNASFSIATRAGTDASTGIAYPMGVAFKFVGTIFGVNVNTVGSFGAHSKVQF